MRKAALSALGIASAKLVARSNGQTCVNNGICRGCDSFDDCGLPSALSAKEAGVRQTAPGV